MPEDEDGAMETPGVHHQAGILQRISSAIVCSLENSFFKLGHSIGERPVRYMLACLLVVLLSSLGFLRFHKEQQPVRLWLPRNSDFVRDTDWLINNFGETYRLQSVIITADNVLQPHVLLKLQDIHEQVQTISSKGTAWADICFRIPALTLAFSNQGKSRNKHQQGSLTDDGGNDDNLQLADWVPIHDGDNQLYCAIVEGLERKCVENNLLELWRYNRTRVTGLCQQDIIEAINTTSKSPVFGFDASYLHLLGGIKRNDSGTIVSAKALRTLWIVQVNFSAVDYEKSGNTAGTGDLADARTLVWEEKFIEVMEAISKNASDNMTIYFSSGRSFGDISNEAMIQDMDKIAVGIIIMFVYIQIMLSKFDWIEMRLLLGSAGLMCIGMALVVSHGLCSLLGIFFGPVHNALPFLMLGIGIDDMFIIMQSWFNLEETKVSGTLAEKIGLTMKHAGASITVTSVTDFVAFAIGATTILPCLQSFCMYAAVGILATYGFQSTFFVACLVVDQKRIEARRNGLVVCYHHENYQPVACSQRYFAKEIFHAIFSKLVLTVPGKVIVILTTVALMAVSIKGNLELTQEFDQMWFIPKETHLAEHEGARLRLYPEDGQEAGVYLGRLNYSVEFRNIERLVRAFKSQRDILHDVESWTDGFHTYVARNFHLNLSSQAISDKEFSTFISKYLFSPYGGKHQKNFRFDGALVCGSPAPQITVSSFEFKFTMFQGSEEHIPALHRVKKLIQDHQFSTGDRFSTVWGKIFANWVTDEIIDHEMYRNLALAMVCVMVTTFLLIANVRICLMVLTCVVLTLIDVGGLMYFWGLTIDVVSCVGLVLAVGLCVDYAAHIGLAFMTCTGGLTERALHTVHQTGPAVMNGGLSTLLALTVLSVSKAHVFISFFKIFLLVVVFGLFHGLVALPVALSLIGPSSHASERSDSARWRRQGAEEQISDGGVATTMILLEPLGESTTGKTTE